MSQNMTICYNTLHVLKTVSDSTEETGRVEIDLTPYIRRSYSQVQKDTRELVELFARRGRASGYKAPVLERASYRTVAT
jgi:hypothetical protein